MSSSAMIQLEGLTICYGNFVAVDRLAVSPQCGFASLNTGNPLTVEAQTRKLALVCELARDIWGDT